MIDRKGNGERGLICDDCEDEEFGPYPKEDFGAMVADARDNGWTVTKSNGEFHHQCPDCKPSRLQRARDLFGG